MMRIGILAEGFAEWQGGVDLLRMISDCLRLGFESSSLELLLLYPRLPALAAVHQTVLPWRRWLFESLEEGRVKPWRQLVRKQIDQSAIARLARVRESVGANVPVVRFRDDRELDEVARMRGLDCLMPSFRALSASVRVPWVGYLYDFQHRHLPDLFKADDREARDQQFAAMAKSARRVIVNSRQVANDCARFLGDGGAKFVPLPFGAAPMAEWLVDRPALLAKHALPARYFLVSNQFWTHKNHRLVFEALAQVVARSAQAPESGEVAIVCTGSTQDDRDPDYFPSLERFLDARGIAHRVRILGFVPKRDQIEIMKGALAVIQPTLFEGGPGGGAVYDAVSLGVPALVSDIPVNRELAGLGLPVEFFSPTDVVGLAALMIDRMRAPAVARKAAGTLVAEGRARRRAVGKVLVETLEAVRAGYGVP